MSTDQDTTSLRLLNALIRALAHQVRTPLSVISNELTVYKTLLPGENVGRLLERCRGISALLQKVSLPHERSDVAADIVSIARAEGAEVRGAQSVFVGLSERQARWLCAALRAVFCPGSAPWVVHMNVHESSVVLSFTADHPGFTTLSEMGSRAECTELFNYALDLDLLEPPLIDALLQSLGAQIRIEPRPEGTVTISIPLAGAYDQ